MQTTKKLKTMEHEPVVVEIDKYNNIVLKSYGTIVAHIDGLGWLEIVSFDPPNTQNHIKAFMEQYTPFTLNVAKNIYNKECLINIYTQDVMYI